MGSTGVVLLLGIVGGILAILWKESNSSFNYASKKQTLIYLFMHYPVVKTGLSPTKTTNYYLGGNYSE